MNTNTDTTTDNTTITKADLKSWKASDAGPRQIGRINKVLGALRRAGLGTIELQGVKGQTEYRTHVIADVVTAVNDRSQAAIDAEHRIGTEYAWTVTRKTAARLAKDLEQAARDVDATIPVVDKRMTAEEGAERQAQTDAALAKMRTESDNRKARVAESHAPILAKRPASAQALIVAELDHDDSDSMTDYFAHNTTRRVAIGWRTGSREDFRQLRRAAAGFEHTAHLGPDAEDSVEHRENYSMGGGNYVKAGSRHSTGWRVVSVPLTADGIGCTYELEDAIPASETRTAPGLGNGNGQGFEVLKTTNKKGEFFLVVPDVRVGRDVFEQLRDSAKQAGGWYSRKWGSTPGGFGFPDEATATEWAEANLSGDDAPPPAPTDPASEREDRAQRFEDKADRLQAEIDRKRAPLSQNWTARRARIKEGMRADADRLETFQRALRALASALRSNSLPPILAGLGTLQSVERTLASGRRIRQALLDLVEAHTTEADRQAEADRRAEHEAEAQLDKFREARIPGFFPTPEPIIDRLWRAAGMTSRCAPVRFLEPSAGIGSIAKRMARHVEVCGGELVVIERNSQLCDYMRGDGLDPLCEDFLDWCDPYEADVILMNPPFEKRADVAHVTHACSFLAPGGVLVAIMTPRGAETIQDWRPDAEVEELPEGSFRGVEAFRQTGVSVRMVTIREGE